MTDLTKVCATCKSEKPMQEFYGDKTRADGKRQHCKACDKAKSAQRYANRVKLDTGAMVGEESRLECPTCGDTFTTPNRNRKFCSTKCKNVDTWTRERSRSGRRYQSERCCFTCGEQFTAEHPKWINCSPECIKQYNTYMRGSHKTRAMLYGVEYQRVPKIKIYDRDKWTCGLCGELIDKGAKYPDPLSVSLDHVVPISHGGPHTPANLQAAHWICNVSKSNRVEEET